MSDEDPTTPDDTAASAPTRRRAVIIGSIAGGVVVLGLIGALVVAIASGGSGSAPTPAPTTSAAVPSPSPPAADASSATPTPEASSGTPIADDVFGTPVAAETKVGQAAEVQGVTVSIDSVTPETAEGQRPGETSGPAVRIVVRISNSGSIDLDLAGIAVRAYTGSDLSPASPIDEGTGFSGSVPAGGEATGTYLFTIPDGTQDEVTITVGVSADSGLAVFTP